MRWRLGWNVESKTEIVIPIYSNGELVDVKGYRPLDKRRKMRHIWVGAKFHIYGDEVFDGNDTIVLCEGEPDCWVSNQHGIPTVTSTGGAKTPIGMYRNLFRDKRVYVCYDADKEGAQQGPARAEELYGIASEVYLVSLGPHLPKEGKDISDFYAAGGTADAFRRIMEETDPFMPKSALKAPPAPSDAPIVPLADTINMPSGKPVAVHVAVLGRRSQPWRVPRRIVAACSQDKGDACNTCKMLVFNGERTVDIEPNDPRIAEYFDSTSDTRTKINRKLVEAKCTDRVGIDEEEETHVLEINVKSRLEDGAASAEEQPRVMYAVGLEDDDMSSTNTGIAAVVQEIPQPKTQRAALLAWGLKRIDSSIDSFRMTDEIMEALEAFCPKQGQSPIEKMVEIADDMSHTVTGIVDSPLLHVAYDIVYHSVLRFPFGIEPEEKGWIDAAVVGDTRTGKTQIAERLMKHYREGGLVSCEQATEAGLIGGVAKFGSTEEWTVRWGELPRYDRRLLVLDEFSGFRSGSKDGGLIDQMSSVRSSGIAKLSKISAAVTNARTRLIWISNPRGSYGMLRGRDSAGIGALTDLIATAEDIARFDFFMSVPAGVANITQPRGGDPKYTSDMCSNLIRWVWSRTPDQVLISCAAEDTILSKASEIGALYSGQTGAVPLVQKENMFVPGRSVLGPNQRVQGLSRDVRRRGSRDRRGRCRRRRQGLQQCHRR
jgi:hypothetical protein